MTNQKISYNSLVLSSNRLREKEDCRGDLMLLVHPPPPLPIEIWFEKAAKKWQHFLVGFPQYFQFQIIPRSRLIRIPSSYKSHGPNFSSLVPGQSLCRDSCCR